MSKEQQEICIPHLSLLMILIAMGPTVVGKTSAPPLWVVQGSEEVLHSQHEMSFLVPHI
jgi:hypothetical protein